MLLKAFGTVMRLSTCPCLLVPGIPEPSGCWEGWDGAELCWGGALWWFCCVIGNAVLQEEGTAPIIGTHSSMLGRFQPSWSRRGSCSAIPQLIPEHSDCSELLLCFPLPFDEVGGVFCWMGAFLPQRRNAVGMGSSLLGSCLLLLHLCCSRSPMEV